MSLQEGDPPLGNERGALGVGTGPTPSPERPPDPPERKTVSLLKPPKKEDNPVKKRQPREKTVIQSNKITSMFAPITKIAKITKTKDNNLSQDNKDRSCSTSTRAEMDQQRCKIKSNGQTQDSIEPAKVDIFSRQKLPGKPDLATISTNQKLSLNKLNTGIPANLASDCDPNNAS